MTDIPKLRHLPEIPRKLNLNNIDDAINKYKELLHSGFININERETPYNFLKAIKRTKLTAGPYTGVSLFEAANRIMSDLVILFGVKNLLTENFDGVMFDEFHVCLGNENLLPHDLNAKTGEFQLSGEAFNVAESFFYLKRKSSLEKLLESESNSKRFTILLYNDDATSTTFDRAENVIHYPVNIKL